MPEICFALRKRLCRTTLGPGYEVGESSAVGAARQVGPTKARANLYGFADMLDAAPGRQTSRELGYGITDTWDDLVEAIQEIAPTTLEGVNQRVTELATTLPSLIGHSIDHCPSDGGELDISCRFGHSRWMLAISRNNGEPRSAKADQRGRDSLGRGTEDSNEPQDSDDRAQKQQGTL
ncbi:hypothetical protein Tco_0660703 [Tanacetum coccineum]